MSKKNVGIIISIILILAIIIGVVYLINNDNLNKESDNNDTAGTSLIDDENNQNEQTVINNDEDLNYFKGAKQMTLDDVIELSKKGDDLTFKDFDDYEYYDVGSGLIVEKFEIDDNYELLVGGSSAFPMYVRLRYTENKSEEDYKEIDIRTDDVEKFIQENND